MGNHVTDDLTAKAAQILDEILTGGYSHDGANSYLADQMRKYAAEQRADILRQVAVHYEHFDPGEMFYAPKIATKLRAVAEAEVRKSVRCGDCGCCADEDQP